MHLSLFLRVMPLSFTSTCGYVTREEQGIAGLLFVSVNILEPASEKWIRSLSELLCKNVAPHSKTAVPDVGKGKCLQNDASLSTFSAIPLSSAHSEIWICKQRRGSNKRRIAIILIRRAENGWYPFPNFSAKMLHHIVIEQFCM